MVNMPSIEVINRSLTDISIWWMYLTDDASGEWMTQLAGNFKMIGGCAK